MNDELKALKQMIMYTFVEDGKVLAGFIHELNDSEFEDQEHLEELTYRYHKLFDAIDDFRLYLSHHLKKDSPLNVGSKSLN